MFCIKCGKELKDKIKYCPYCGKKIPVDLSVNEVINIAKKNIVEPGNIIKKKAIESIEKIDVDKIVKITTIDEEKTKDDNLKNKKSLINKIKNNKNIIFILIIITSIIIGTIYDGTSISNPEKVVEKFFLNIKNGNFEKALTYTNCEELYGKEGKVKMLKELNLDLYDMLEFKEIMTEIKFSDFRTVNKNKEWCEVSFMISNGEYYEIKQIQLLKQGSKWKVNMWNFQV